MAGLRDGTGATAAINWNWPLLRGVSLRTARICYVSIDAWSIAFVLIIHGRPGYWVNQSDSLPVSDEVISNSTLKFVVTFILQSTCSRIQSHKLMTGSVHAALQ
jgi:hypothetical protein